MRLLTASLVMLGCLLAAWPADACTVDMCSLQPGTPLDGRAIPSGLTLLPAVGASDKPAKLFLGDVEIATSPTEVGDAKGTDKVLKMEPLAPGHYRLVHVESCGKHIAEGLNTSGFDVTAAAPVAPATLGKITVQKTFIPGVGGAPDLTCGWIDIDRVVFKISFTPSAELEPLLPLLKLAFTVDGPSGTNARLGTGKTAPDSTVLTALHVACGDRKSSQLATVPKGTYKVNATGTVLGTDLALPSTSLEIAADCNGFESQRTDPGATDDDGGCSQTSRRSGSSFGAGVLVAVALALRALRTRTRV